MQNNKWKKLEKLVDKCYINMIGAEKDGSCWQKTFDYLMNIVREERRINPNYVPEIEMLEDEADYSCDITGWLEDCLDEMDMNGDYSTLLKMCNELLTLFSWPEYTGSDIKFRKASALSSLGQLKESVEYCEKWIQEEQENIVAATAGIYAFIKVKEYEKGEKLVEKFILYESDCNDDNDIVFTAASALYKAMKKNEKKRVIDKAIKEYEKRLEEYMTSFDYDDDYDDLFGEGLPFN